MYLFFGLWEFTTKGIVEILGIAAGSREDKESWTNFLRYLKDCGLFGVKLIEAEETRKKYCRNAEGDSCAQDWEMDFPYEHWTRLCTNNALRIMKEIRRRTRIIGAFPDGYSAMMLVGARLRHISTTKWGTRLYLNTCKRYKTV